MRWRALVAGGLVSTACGGTDEPVGGTDAVGAVIGPAGGEAVSADGKLRIIIPVGALVEDIELTIESTVQAPASLGPAYHAAPQVSLNELATVIYRWDASDIGDVDPEFLSIGVELEGHWVPLERIGVDEDALEVTCSDPAISFFYGLIEDLPPIGGSSSGSGTVDDTGSSSGGTASGSETSGTGSGTGMGTGTGTGTGSEATSSSTGEPTFDCGNGIARAGEVCLLEGISIGMGSAPTAVVAADFDEDGDLDLATANGLDDTLSRRLGVGNGFFGSQLVLPVGASPVDVLAADVDDDGNIDLVSAGIGSVSLWLGNGDGTFEDGGTVAVGTDLAALALDTFDADTLVDVVACDTTGGTAWLLPGLDGSFGTGTSFPTGTTPRGIVTGDFNDDANLDLVTADAGGATLLSGNGTGLFGAPSSSAVLGIAQALASADLNGDSNPDVVVASADIVTVLLGNGLGGFGAGVPFAVGAQPVAVILADVSGDGDLDVIVANAGDNTVDVLPGNGAGSLAAAITFAVGAAPSGLAAGDVNGDDALDVLVAHSGDDDVGILISDP